MVCGFRRRVVSGMREKGVCCVDLQASKVPIKQCTDRQVLARQLQVVPMALSIGTLRGRCDEGIAQHQESRIKILDARNHREAVQFCVKARKSKHIYQSMSGPVQPSRGASKAATVWSALPTHSASRHLPHLISRTKLALRTLSLPTSSCNMHLSPPVPDRQPRPTIDA
jgi:hypothetical protein